MLIKRVIHQHHKNIVNIYSMNSRTQILQNKHQKATIIVGDSNTPSSHLCKYFKLKIIKETSEHISTDHFIQHIRNTHSSYVTSSETDLIIPQNHNKYKY